MAGQTALIPGSDSGIGQATAVEFARESANVVVNCLEDAQGADRAAPTLKRQAGGPSSCRRTMAYAQQLLSRGMEQRVSLITLGVEDLRRSKAFYAQLGWRGREVEETVFFQAGGQAVVLWSRDKLAEDAGIVDSGSGRFSGITLAHNVASREEVDQIMAASEGAGADVTKPPRETFYGGYAGYFRDPDGHVWEVACNPGFTLGEDGVLILPDVGEPT